MDIETVENRIADVVDGYSKFDPSRMLDSFDGLPIGNIVHWARTQSGVDLSAIEQNYPFYFSFKPIRITSEMWNQATDEDRRLWLTIMGIEYAITDEFDNIRMSS